MISIIPEYRNHNLLADAHNVTLLAVMRINVHPGQLGLHGKRP
jgi:hypothetical protein